MILYFAKQGMTAPMRVQAESYSAEYDASGNKISAFHHFYDEEDAWRHLLHMAQEIHSINIAVLSKSMQECDISSAYSDLLHSSYWAWIDGRDLEYDIPPLMTAPDPDLVFHSIIEISQTQDEKDMAEFIEGFPDVIQADDPEEEVG